MKALISSVHAVMTRRILVNFRVRPDVAATLLPLPFRPKLVNGWAMAGICLIRLEDMRPAWLPSWCGVVSENAAHRIAVEWSENGRTREGVFIPRRDTNSLLNRIAGGRFFPGVHHPARFRSNEDGSRFEVELRSRDGETRVSVAGRVTDSWPTRSVFKNLEDASVFFRNGGCGWSPVNGCSLEGVELRTENWEMRALEIESVASSYFSDPRRFPAGAVEFDCALLMRGISHQWRALGRFPRANASHRHGASALFEMP